MNIQTIRVKSKELNILFKDLFAGCVMEEIVLFLSQWEKGKEYWLSNVEDLNLETYKKGSQRLLRFYHVGNSTEEEFITYLVEKGKEQGIVIQYHNQLLQIKIDDYYVPIHLQIEKENITLLPNEVKLQLTLENSKYITIYQYPYDQIIGKDFVKILSMLELIQDMKPYLEIYQILQEQTLDGRRIKEAIQREVQQMTEKQKKNTFQVFSSYKNYNYMEKKWNQLIKKEKEKELQWQEVMNTLLTFLSPIWEAIENDDIFFGDWMPQLQRFLD